MAALALVRGPLFGGPSVDIAPEAARRRAHQRAVRRAESRVVDAAIAEMADPQADRGRVTIDACTRLAEVYSVGPRLVGS